MWISVLFPKCGLTCGGESVKLWKVKKRERYDENQYISDRSDRELPVAARQ
jgi:hypothetical protein